MTQKPQWIIFDVGGVLLDWPSSSVATAKALGITRDELFDALYDQTVPVSIGAKMNTGELAAEEGWAQVLERLGKTDFTPEQIINGWYARDYWFDDSLRLVNDLHNAGYKLAIMSNSWLGLTDPKKREVFPEELQKFTYVFDSSVEKMKKPDVRFYELVESRTASSKESLLLIDDDSKNLTPAQARDWQTFFFENKDRTTIAESVQQLRKLLL